MALPDFSAQGDLVDAPDFSGQGDLVQGPQKPESALGAVSRGVKESFQQLPQLAYGVGAGAAAAVENVVGEGGVATAAKNAAMSGYRRWGQKIADHTRENDSIDVAWDKAKEGDLGALVDWLAHGIGYVGGQGLQALATGGIGYAAGKVTAQGAAKAIAGGMIKKEAERIGETAAAKAAVTELGADAAADQIIKEATAHVAGRIGSSVALGTAAFGQEAGETFGGLLENNPTPTGEQLGKAFASSLAAGGLEFLGDKLGLDAALGKLPLGKTLEKAPGIGGRLARGATAAALTAPVEAATEYGQTLLEEFGKGNEDTINPFAVSEATSKQARESAALGALGGGLIGGAAATRGVPKQPEATPADVIAAPDFDTAVERFNASISGTAIDTVGLLDAATAERALVDEKNATLVGVAQQDLEQAQVARALRIGDVVQDATGSYHVNSGDYSAPLRVWDEQPAADGQATIPTEQVAAEREHYKNLGFNLVYYEDNPLLPDGVYDKTQPGVLFLSNNPSRHIEQIAAHEVKHGMEDLPLLDAAGKPLLDRDGRKLTTGQLLNDAIRYGITDEGWQHAISQFSSTMPEMPGEGATVEEQKAWAAQWEQHMLTELGADVGGEATKFETFMPKVVAHIETKYGADVAKSFFKNFIQSIKNAFETLKKFFGKDETQSQHWVKNLEEVHNVLADMYARQYGTQYEKQSAAAREQERQQAREIDSAFAKREGKQQRTQDFETKQLLIESRNKFGAIEAERQDTISRANEANQPGDTDRAMRIAMERAKIAAQKAPEVEREKKAKQAEQAAGLKAESDRLRDAEIAYYLQQEMDKREATTKAKANVELLRSADKRREDLAAIADKRSSGQLVSQDEILKERLGPVQAPADASPDLKKAFETVAKAPFLRTADEKVNVKAIEEGTKFSPKEGLKDFRGLSLRRPSQDIRTQAASAYADGPFRVLRGVREIPLSEVELQGGDLYDSPERRERIRALADRISKNRSIEPLYVARRPDGTQYLAEGQHRARALKLLGYDAIPARVTEPEGGVQQSPKVPQTPEFKAWFEGSKVVDANGEPLVMYHGTHHADINVFEGERRVAGHFAFSPEVAEAYANAQGDQPDGQLVYPAYLAARSIFDARNPEHRARVGMKYQEGASFGFSDLERHVDRMRRAGFDSYYDFEYAIELSPDSDPQGLAVFSPNQIKSVFNDSPTDSPNISQAPKAPTSDINHKRTSTDGRYVGAPDWVGNSPQKLAALRSKLAQLAKEGEAGRYWYEKSARAVLRLVGGDKEQAERFVGLLSIFSQGTNLSVNTTFALQAWYQHAAGVPVRAGRFPEAMSKKAQAWLDNGEDYGGIKVNNFYTDLMEEIDPTKVDHTHATMDMWMAIAFDYGTKVLDQGPRYNFALRETAALAEKMGWRPHQVQAAIWTAIRARVSEAEAKYKAREVALKIRERKPNGKPGDVIPGREYDHHRLVHRVGMAHPLTQQEVDRHNEDYDTELAARTAQMSWEAEPGRTSGLLPGLRTAPLAQKQEYLEAVIKTLTGSDGTDLVAELAGISPGRALRGLSAWEGTIGAGVQTLLPIHTEGVKADKKVAPLPRAALNLFAAIKGYVMSQDAVVWHLPVYEDSAIRHNGLDLVTARALTPEEMSALYAAVHKEFGTWEIAPGFTDAGARLLNFVEGLGNARFQQGMEQIILTLPEEFGGGIVGRAGFRSDGEYISNNWQEKPNGEGYGDYLRAGRPELQKRAAGLRARVAAVNGEFAAKYGWDRAPDTGAGGTERDGEPSGDSLRLSPKQGQLDLVGVHFSSASRAAIDGRYFGTGMKGAEEDRVRAASDNRIKTRVYAYANTGQGVFPEKYVGGQPHTIPLNNLYDLDSDPLSLVVADQTATESAVLDNGFDGYVVRLPRHAVAVLLGRAAQGVPAQAKDLSYRGADLPAAPAPTYTEAVKLAMEVSANRNLPAGQMLGARWPDYVKRIDPDLFQRLDARGVFARLQSGEQYYKSDLARLARTPLPEGGIPLSEITVNVQAIEAETGKRLVMREKADVALRDVDDQLSKARMLLECLRS